MAVDIVATREVVLASGGDVDNDGVVDPGDTVTGKIRVTNNGTNNPADNATGVTVTDSLTGLTVDPTSVEVTPIAFDDNFSITGNTPITFTKAQLLGNDVDPDGAEANLVVTLGTATNGTIVDNGDGTYTFTPTTGLDVGQTAGFEYTLTDEQGLQSVTPGVVTATISDVVWYVDKNYAGENGAPDGSYMRPYTSLTPLNNNAVDSDADGDTIFVYNNGAGTYSAGITLEANQTLRGDGAAFVVNGHNIGGTERTGGADDVTTDTVISQASGTIVTLGTNNTITGLTIGDNAGSAVGISGTNFGTLTISDASIDTAGQALNLDTGAIAGAGLTSTSSDGATAAASNVALNAVTGTLSLGSGALANGASGGLVITGGSVNVTYGGTIGQTANAAAVSVSGGHTGTLLQTGAVSATNGSGLQFDNADGTYNFFGGGTLNGGGAGIDILNGSAGTFNFGQSGVTTFALTHNVAGDAFVVDATSVTPSFATITYNGSITDTTGNAVFIDEHDAGSITFQNGSITSIGAGAGGIDITNSSGGSVTFSNDSITLSTGANTAFNFVGNNSSVGFYLTTAGSGLDITTTSGTGFNATGGGTIVVADPVGAASNSITTTTGTALNVANTTIGPQGITFESISANGATNGIVLNNTGTSGGLTVTGNGTTVGAGGTITNTTGAGVVLTNTAGVSLNGMTISNTGSHGVSGTGVTNIGNSGTVNNSFSFTNGALTSPGDGDNESALWFDTTSATNITGRMTVSNTTISNFEDVGVHVGNVSGNLVINVTDVVFNNNSDTNGEEGIDVDASGTANTTLNVSGTPTGAVTSAGFTSTTRFIDLEGGAINATVQGNGVLDLNLTGVLVTGTGGPDNFPTPPAMTFSAEGSNSTFTFDITGNRIADSSGDGIFIGHEGTIQGRIQNNAIVDAATGDGIRIDTDTTSSSTSTILISGNTISNVGDDGIQVLHRDGTKPMHLTITNNVFSNTVSEAIRVFADDDVSGGGPDLNLSITNNSFSNIATNGFDYSIYLSAQDTGTEVNTHVTGNTGLTTTASRGIAFVQSSSGSLTSSATNAAGLSGANGGVDIDETGTVNYNVPVTVNTPSNPLFAAVRPEVGGLEEATPAAAPKPVQTPAPDQSAPGATEADSAGETVPATDDGVVDAAELALLVDAAIARWEAAGATAAQLAAMRAVDVNVIDMAGVYLGSSGNGVVNLDSDGAGWGWFVDATPGDDAEFANGTATADGGAAGKLDLLTVIMHELGHQIGLDDDYQTAAAGELMYGYLNTGQRHLPGAGDVAGATGQAVTGVYALAPVSVGTLPAGKAVDVYFTATVDAPPAGVIVNPQGTATVSGGNFANVNVNSTIVLDSLTLGDRVFLDADKDGMFDAGEGINGVTLSLYVDADQDGTPDGAAIATTITAGVGMAAGGYSFSGLAPGNYLVRVDASNFTGGGALAGRVATTNGGDPDNDTNNDSNAGTVGVDGSSGGTITLSYNGETTDDGTGQNDINDALDFGFVAPNQAPTSSNLSGDVVTFTEGDGPTPVDLGTNATIADADSADFDGGSLQLTFNIQTGDGFGLDTSGSVALDLLSGDISVDDGGGAVVIGTASFVANGVSIALNANATPARVQEVIRAVVFQAPGDAPVAGTRTFTWTLVDGDGTAFTGNDTLVVTSTVNVVATNDLPSIDGFTGGTIAEFSPVGTVVGTASVSDPDGLAGLVFSLDDDAGGRFAINASTGEVTVADRGALDFESDSTHDIVIRVTDPALAADTFNQTITLTDAAETYLDGPGDGTFTVPTNENWKIYGEAGTDTLTGGPGNDYLDGGTENDAMAGGLGDDGYVVDSLTDTITELSGEGNDRLYALATYVLASGVDIEVLAAGGPDPNAAIDITGNELSQQVLGNAGVNTLDGAGGNDVLFGYGGADSLIGGADDDYLDGGSGDDALAGGTGNDVYVVDAAGDTVTELGGEGADIVYALGDYTLAAGAEIEVMAAGGSDPTAAIDLTGNEVGQHLWGNEGVNVLNGGGGNDILYGHGGGDTLNGGANDDYLDGGTGDDVMSGGTGNDLFVIDSAGDTVTEAAGEGADLAYALVDYTLGAGQEVEVLAAGGPDPNAGIDLTGNELDNQLWGNGGVNVLDGKGGFNILVGAGGADDFVFSSALGSGNLGVIVDFASGSDRLVLDDAIFGQLATGALAAGSFVAGTAALDADDYVLYDQATGSLFYDADGNGSGEAVRFGVIADLSPVAASDFLIA